MSGSYAILERIAVGGMGEVFLARQTGIGGFARTVVLKRLLPDAEGDDEALRRLLDEARIAGMLAHENVVSIIEVGAGAEGERGVPQGAPFLALEYVHGDNAGILIRRARQRHVEISALVAARIVRDAARGLAHAHAARASDGTPLGIVHRDVAPKNVFVRNDGVAKIGDFGIAKAERNLAATATGSVPGTLAYMSPEQVRGETVGPASDQFSLGIVLWELLCAHRLFKGASPAETVEAVLRKRVRAPSKMNAAAWPLDDIALRMLERDPSLRYADLNEVVAAIEAAMPEVAGEEARREVAQLVEQLLGAELRAREIKIEQGPVTPETTVRVPASGTFDVDVPRTSEPTASATDAPTLLERPRPPRRVPRVAAAAALLAALIAGGAIAARDDDDDRTRAYLEKARTQNAIIDREVIFALARIEGVELATATRAADRAEELVRQRLALAADAWQLDEQQRRERHRDLLARDRELVEQARDALRPLGPELHELALDMWAFDSSLPERWTEPLSDLEVQSDLMAGALQMMHEQAPMRDLAVDALLVRGGADPRVVRTALDPLIARREALIEELADAPPQQIDALRARIEELEQAAHDVLQQRAPKTADAAASLALWLIPRRGEREPMFPAMPSMVTDKEHGAVVAER